MDKNSRLLPAGEAIMLFAMIRPVRVLVNDGVASRGDEEEEVAVEEEEGGRERG